MSYEDPLVWFDPSKPFYSIVLNYLSYLAGFQDLFLRGSGSDFSDRFRELYRGHSPGASFSVDTSPGLWPPEPTWLKALPPDIPPAHREKFHAEWPLMVHHMDYAAADPGGSIHLPSKWRDAPLRILLKDAARHIPKRGRPQAEEWIRASGFPLILAYETTKDYHDQGPLWEFLRHCRHAAAHGGRFNFLHDEPRRKAEWGPFRIERSLQGTPLIEVEETDGFLGRADPIFLLRDIEHAYFGGNPPNPP